ncbi:small GTP-binding protein [Histomonas meleagridis]|uniref:small GTP-binding protein n=1 Tax=Histomonas meleagridis TaxID=135588 RepID=UPI00355A80A6|nr:small GTP-binding protein [Histomonas meleagridis]KAH0798544.1 small GTP-binding protein [Histomonas meleagridis]
MELNAKVVFIGPPNSGKSSIFNRYSSNVFVQDLPSSTQPALFKKQYQCKNGKKLGVEYWDTAGQERYRALSPLFYQKANIALIIFDLTDRDSFEQALEWSEQACDQSSDAPLQQILVGNKCDLDNKKISIEEMQECGEKMHAPVFQTSAKTGEGINLLFESVVELLSLDNQIKFESSLPEPKAGSRCCS